METPTGTREKLIIAAEQLFAERGIQDVSLRQINNAAGQRNASATHYHFGSRDTLVRAIFEYRMTGIDQRRQEILRQVEAAEGVPSLRSLAESMVRPIAEQVMQDAGGANYVRFMAHARNDPNYRMANATEGLTQGLARTNELLRNVLPDIPWEITKQRLVIATTMVINTLSDLAAIRTHNEQQGKSFDPDMAIENLIDMVAGALSADVSPACLEKLD